MINFSMNTKAQTSTPNHNYLHQEFDDVFPTFTLPKLSRKLSTSLRLRFPYDVTPGPIEDDFTAINALIQQKVNEPVPIGSKPFFIDIDSIAEYSAPRPTFIFPTIPQIVLNESQIESILNSSPFNKDPKTNNPEAGKDNELDAYFFGTGSEGWPEGWVNLLECLQKEPPTLQYNVGSGGIDKSKKSMNQFNLYESLKDKEVLQGPNTNGVSPEVGRKDDGDKSLEKNPYFKLKSKKELEQERKNKEKTNQQENVIASKKTIVVQNQSKAKSGSEQNLNKPRVEEQKSSNNGREIGYNNGGISKEKALPSKVVDERQASKTSTGWNQREDSFSSNGKQYTKEKEQRKENEEKSYGRGGESGRYSGGQQNVKAEQAKKEEPNKLKKVEEKKQEKEQVKNGVKEEKGQQGKVRNELEGKKETQKSVEQRGRTEDVGVKEKTVQKEVKVEKSQTPSESNEKMGVKTMKTSESNQEKEVKGTTGKVEKEKEEKEKESESREVSQSEQKSETQQQQEEFITLKKKKKKNKNKNEAEEKLDSKKQVLADKVKKETDKLIQNQFIALQAINNAQPAAGAKDAKDSKPVVVEVKEELAPVQVVEKAQENKEVAAKSKKNKSKKKKKGGQKDEKENNEEKKEEEENTKEQEDDKSVTQEAGTVEANLQGKKEEKSISTNKEEQSSAANGLGKTEEKESEKLIEIVDSKEDESGQGVADASKNKKKRKRNKKKNKDKENDNDMSHSTLLSGGLEVQDGRKVENKKETQKTQKNAENEGSTEDDDGGNDGLKQEYQFSKSKKKKLKKKAKQQTLSECLENAELKLAEFRSEYFIESSILLDDKNILDKFKKLLEFHKEMANEVKGTLVAEAFKEMGPGGEKKIKLQVTLKQRSDENTEEEKKKKKKKSKNMLAENESTNTDFDSFQKITTEDIENIQLDEADLLEPKEEIDTGLDIGYFETLIKNKSEGPFTAKPERRPKDLQNLALHEILETIEERFQRTQDFGGLLTMS